MKIKFALLAVVTLLLASCSKDMVEVTCKELKTTGTELVSVPDKSYVIQNEENDGSHRLSIGVAFELKKSLSGIEGLKLDDIVLEKKLVLSVFDEENKELCSMEMSGDSSITAFKQVLQGKVGETKRVTFTKAIGEDQAKEVIEKAKYFKIETVQVGLKNINLSGAVDRYKISMTVNIDGEGNMTGAYYYTSKGPSMLLYVKGKAANDGSWHLEEFTAQGQHSAVWNGTFNDGVFAGNFATPSNQFTYRLTRDFNMEPIIVVDVPYSTFQLQTPSSDTSSSYSSGGGGVADWLDEYEEYVDSYISLLQKAADGDMSALAEYSKFYKKAVELSKKIEESRGDMSTSDWERYAEINQHFLEAVQEMQ